MAKAFGIINACDRANRVLGLEDYRPVGAFSFIGRYRVIDFMISNFSNSGINQIQVYTGTSPLPLSDHLGTGRQYNINSKRGRLHLLFSRHAYEHNLYNNAITSYIDHMDHIESMPYEYVVLAPSHMVYIHNFDELLQDHVESGADVTMLYHTVDNAKTSFLSNFVIGMDKDKRVTSIELNNGAAKTRNIMMGSYVMKKDLFIDLVHKAHKTSSLYSLGNIISDQLSVLNVRGVSHRGYFASITDFDGYFRANMSLIDMHVADNLFRDDWPVYTKTTDSPPTRYLETASVSDSIVSNGCVIEGSIQHSIIGRNCVIGKGSVVRNCIVMGYSRIGENVTIENMVVDKHCVIDIVKHIAGTKEHPEYVKRGDRL